MDNYADPAGLAGADQRAAGPIGCVAVLGGDLLDAGADLGPDVALVVQRAVNRTTGDAAELCDLSDGNRQNGPPRFRFEIIPRAGRMGCGINIP